MKLVPFQIDALDQFGWDQLQHDRYFHTDIYVLNTQSTLKHFTLHQAKYLSRILNDLDNNVNLVTLADIFIILTAMATSCKIKTSDLVAGVGLPQGHITDSYSMTKLLITGVSLAAKVCEGLDHVEKQDYAENLRSSIKQIMEAVWQLCGWKECEEPSPISIEMLIALCNARLLQVELFSPQFERLKMQCFSSREKYQQWIEVALIQPTIAYVKSIHAGAYHWKLEGITSAVNVCLLAPMREYAIRKGYLTESLGGELSLTKAGKVFIGVESSGLID